MSGQKDCEEDRPCQGRCPDEQPGGKVQTKKDLEKRKDVGRQGAQEVGEQLVFIHLSGKAGQVRDLGGSSENPDSSGQEADAEAYPGQGIAREGVICRLHP